MCVVSPGYIHTNLSLNAVTGDGSKYGGISVLFSVEFARYKLLYGAFRGSRSIYYFLYSTCALNLLYCSFMLIFGDETVEVPLPSGKTQSLQFVLDYILSEITIYILAVHAVMVMPEHTKFYFK